MTALNKKSKKQSQESRHSHSVVENEVVEFMSKRFVGLNLYTLIMFLLAITIIGTGVKAAIQVQQYHQDYKALQQMKKAYLNLQIEHNRLIIEQQTFSATPQIAARAVAELNMYSPTITDKMIVQPKAISEKPKEKQDLKKVGAGNGVDAQ